MNKNYYLLLPFLFFSITKEAQVGIGTDYLNPSSILEISSGKNQNLGFLGPRISLINSTDPFPIKSPKKGLIIYNTKNINDLIPGYYFWSGNQWLSMSKQKTYKQYYVDEIRVAVLGYYPFGNSETTPEIIEYNTIIANKSKCIKNTTNTNFTPHGYCSYSLNKNINFDDAFNLAKEIGGFIPVITTNEEWNYLKNNFIDQNSSNIWIGYSRNQYPGTSWNNQYIWITGEKSKIDWSGTTISGAPIETNFSPTEDYSGNCSYVNGSTSNKYWQTMDCNETKNTNYLIVELLN